MVTIYMVAMVTLEEDGGGRPGTYMQSGGVSEWSKGWKRESKEVRRKEEVNNGSHSKINPHKGWWRHDMAVLLTLCEENPPISGGVPSQWDNNAELLRFLYS